MSVGYVDVDYLVMILVGALLGGLLVFSGWQRGDRDELRLYAVALVIAGAIYVAFAAAGAKALLPRELLGLALFGAIAALGAWRWPLLLAIGWAAHTAWDVGFHPPGALDAVPWRYPALCVGFDLVVAVRLAWLAARGVAAGPSLERGSGSTVV